MVFLDKIIVSGYQPIYRFRRPHFSVSVNNISDFRHGLSGSLIFEYPENKMTRGDVRKIKSGDVIRKTIKDDNPKYHRIDLKRNGFELQRDNNVEPKPRQSVESQFFDEFTK